MRPWPATAPAGRDRCRRCRPGSPRSWIVLLPRGERDAVLGLAPGLGLAGRRFRRGRRLGRGRGGGARLLLERRRFLALDQAQRPPRSRWWRCATAKWCLAWCGRVGGRRCGRRVTGALLAGEVLDDGAEAQLGGLAHQLQRPVPVLHPGAGRRWRCPGGRTRLGHPQGVDPGPDDVQRPGRAARPRRCWWGEHHRHAALEVEPSSGLLPESSARAAAVGQHHDEDEGQQDLASHQLKRSAPGGGSCLVGLGRRPSGSPGSVGSVACSTSRSTAWRATVSSTPEPRSGSCPPAPAR